MEPLGGLIKAHSEVGVAAAELLAKRSKGNFRRLSQFAQHLNSLKKMQINAAAVDEEWDNAFGEAFLKAA